MERSRTKRLTPQFVTVKIDGSCGGQGCLNKPMTSRMLPMEGRETSNEVRERLDEAVEELRQSRGENHPEFIFALTTIANACAKNGDDADSIRYYNKVLPLVKKLEGPSHPKVADVMVSLALSIEKIGKYEDGLQYLIKALEIYVHVRSLTTCRKKKSMYWFKITNALNQIGNYYFHQGKIDEAGQKYSEALKASKKFLSDDLPEDSCLSLHVAEIVNNAACVKAEKKEYEKSINLFSQALELQIAGLGEEDPSVSITLNNIGTMNFKARKYEVALKSYKQVLKMRRKLFNKDHYSVGEVLIDIAACYEKIRDFERAGRALKEALRITILNYGHKHSKINLIYEKLGAAAKLAGYEKQSEKYFKAAQNNEGDNFFESRIFSH